MKKLLLIGLLCSAAAGAFAMHNDPTPLPIVKRTTLYGPDSLKCAVSMAGGLTFNNVASNSIDVSWPAAPGAIKYRVHLVLVDLQQLDRSFFTTETSVHITGLLGGTNYSVGVSATACD
jgi:hypothetical protein